MLLLELDSLSFTNCRTQQAHFTTLRNRGCGVRCCACRRSQRYRPLLVWTQLVWVQFSSLAGCSIYVPRVATTHAWHVCLVQRRNAVNGSRLCKETLGGSAVKARVALWSRCCMLLLFELRCSCALFEDNAAKTHSNILVACIKVLKKCMVAG